MLSQAKESNNKQMDTIRGGRLYLIPLPIAANTQAQVITTYVVQIIHQLNYFLVENIRTARRYIKAIGHPQPMAHLDFVELNKHTSKQQSASYMRLVQQGRNAGVLTEAGCPGIADPGMLAVQYAHQHQLEVVPLAGPSAILLALMASGLNGQCFTFHGYLPIEQWERDQAIKQLDKLAWQLGQTQIFIETPYRNAVLLEAVLNACRSDTLLCIAKNITGQNSFIRTHYIHFWKNNKPNLYKIPVVFLLASPS